MALNDLWNIRSMDNCEYSWPYAYWNVLMSVLNILFNIFLLSGFWNWDRTLFVDWSHIIQTYYKSPKRCLLKSLTSEDIYSMSTSGIWGAAYLNKPKEIFKVSSSCFLVPRGSVLDPLLFSIYATSLAFIIFSDFCCANDTQLFLSFPPDDSTVSSHISTCLCHFSTWIRESHL